MKTAKKTQSEASHFLQEVSWGKQTPLRATECVCVCGCVRAGVWGGVRLLRELLDALSHTALISLCISMMGELGEKNCGQRSSTREAEWNKENVHQSKLEATTPKAHSSSLRCKKIIHNVVKGFSKNVEF